MLVRRKISLGRSNGHPDRTTGDLAIILIARPFDSARNASDMWGRTRTGSTVRVNNEALAEASVKSLGVAIPHLSLL